MRGASERLSLFALSFNLRALSRPLLYNYFSLPMVRDGYFYGLGLIAAAILVGWFAKPVWAVVPLLLALFL
ncbi:MAG: hypothetical protein WCC95_03570, partial [Candidatus Sulfotelmatobacter sp.]